MKTRIQWIDGVSFVGESGSGHAVVIDGDPEKVAEVKDVATLLLDSVRI